MTLASPKLGLDIRYLLFTDSPFLMYAYLELEVRLQTAAIRDACLGSFVLLQHPTPVSLKTGFINAIAESLRVLH